MGFRFVGVAVRTAVFDTIAALIAALVIIPACFEYKLVDIKSTSLLFVMLPRILQDIPFGQGFAIFLYVACAIILCTVALVNKIAF